MTRKPVLLAAVPVLAAALWAGALGGGAPLGGASWAAVPVAAAPVTAAPVAAAAAVTAAGIPGATGGWTSEQPWGVANDWEPNVAAAPTSSWLYQMTTQYGGARACRPHMGHCVLFRSSADRGQTWHGSMVMHRTKCPPKRSCYPATWQNDPVLAVSRRGVIYAAWMNGWDVVFAKSGDHGRTWTSFHDFRRALGAKFTDKPWLVISPSGRNVYVAFNQSDSYVSASHDYGRHWSKPVRTNADARYWFAEGGAVAPDGNVYFAESAEHQNELGTVRLAVVFSRNRGATWRTKFVATSQQQPPCPAKGCPPDFYGAEMSLAVDRAGTILAAYVANQTAGAPMRVRVITSLNGVSWSAPTGLGSGGTSVGADFPAVAAGQEPGDFRVAWEDDGNGAQAWNVWYRRTTDGGATWGQTVRVSDLGYGAPYKSRAGYRFPYGDYFGLTVDDLNASVLTWSEGHSYTGPGNTWWAHGPQPQLAANRPPSG